MRWRKAALITLAAVVLLFGYELIAVRGTFVRVRAATDVEGKAFLLGESGHRIGGRVYLSGTHFRVHRWSSFCTGTLRSSSRATSIRLHRGVFAG